MPILQRIAPEHLAESWDHVGLHVGDVEQRVRRALLCIDLTEAVAAEAVRRKADLVVAYHPPIFAPLNALTEADAKQRIVRRLICGKVAAYSPHTALDAAAGGVNDWLCEAVLPGVVEAVTATDKSAIAKGGSIRAIRPSETREAERPYKLVTFVPPDHLDKLRHALSEAGAGRIGDYTECSFTLEGEGTFRGGESTNPAVGQRGRLERVKERRIEMIVPAGELSKVVATLMKTHPYEEPAFDLIRLAIAPSQGGEGVGQGRVVTLDKPITLTSFITRMKKHLGVQHLEVAAPSPARKLRTIAFCAGAGGSMLPDAGDVDAFFTGEMRHHDVLGASAGGTAIVLAGHTQTERPYLKTYRELLRRNGGKGIDWQISRADQPPSKIR